MGTWPRLYPKLGKEGWRSLCGFVGEEKEGTVLAFGTTARWSMQTAFPVSPTHFLLLTPMKHPFGVFGIKITRASQNTCGECVWNVCSSSYLLIPVSSEYLISWMKCSGISSIIRSPWSPGAAAEQQCFWEALKTWADGQVKINSGAEGKLISLLQHSETWWIILPSCHKNVTHFTRFYY